MNIGTLELAILLAVAFNALLLIMLHIIGDVRTMRRRLRDSDNKRSGKRDRYRPSLSVVVYHTQESADLTRCLGSIRTNPYPVNKIIIVDMLGDKTAQKTVSDYRKQHTGLKLTYRSFANEASRRQQTGSVQSLVTSKLVMMIDSASVLQPDNVLPAIKTFRNLEVTSLVAQVGLQPGNSLLQGLYTARQALINNFRRAFSGSGLFVARARHPAVLMRAHVWRRVIAKHEDVLPTDVASYTSKDFYNKAARIIWSADFRVWAHDSRFRVRSFFFVLTMLLFVIFIERIIAQLGIYNSMPLIAALSIILVVFAGLAQPKKTTYSVFDKISVSLLAPLTVLLPLAFVFHRRQKSRLSTNVVPR